MEELHVSREALRRFLVKRLGLSSFQSLGSVDEALDRLEFVQMDSIQVCGRIHDLILWPRVKGYQPSDLGDFLYGIPRRGFEYYFPNLSVLRISDYPYFVSRMQASTQPGTYHGLTPDEESLSEMLLRQAHEEPIRTRTLDAVHGRVIGPWGTQTTLAARTVNKLWHHGKLHIHRREGFEKWYAPTEVVAPELAAHHEKPPTQAETDLHLETLRLKGARLFRPKAKQVALLGKEAFCKVTFEGAKRDWYVFREDVQALVDAEHEVDGNEVILVAPLDPLIHDRDRLEELFEFEYRWEVYTPVTKRRWGYYVLPILWGSRLAGRLDPKLDSERNVLQILSLKLEPGVDVTAISGPLAERISAYAAFLGAKKIQWGTVDPKPLKALLKARCGGR